MTVQLEELRDLFTGVPSDDGDWQTTPSYTVALALEIAKRCDTRTEHALRTILFDSSNPDDIPAAALEVIRIAAARYRSLTA